MRAYGFAFVVLLFANALAAAEQYPYTAYVNGDDVYVRSGPGQNYYPTSKLKLGQAVEVYRHDPGGWYAVRPPEGSFCWVAARYLKLERGSIAVVTGDRVVARVGSEFSDIRDVIQVRLDRGEEVEVLETKNLNLAEGGEKWVKVAPVAGEFRWVLGKFLDRMPPEPNLVAQPGKRNILLEDKTIALYRQSDSASARPDDTDLVDVVRSTSVEAAMEIDERDMDGEEETNGRLSTTRQAGSAPWRAAKANPSERLVSYEEPAAKRRDVEQPPAEAPPRKVTLDGNTVNEEAFQAELDSIDLEISKMVVEEPTAWSFSELRTRAQVALSRAQTALERGRARLVLSKITRFETIRDRYEAVAQAQSETDKLNELATASAAPSVPHGGSYAPRFDGSGRLIAIVSPRVGAPQFALIDDSGNIVTYLTASPGVGLRPYIGRHVGISGTRGYIPEYKAQHLTARRVTVLDQPLLR